MKITCPRCDGQGYVLKAKVKKTDQILWICEECNALWLDRSEIKETNFVDAQTYIKKKYHTERPWDEVEFLE